MGFASNSTKSRRAKTNAIYLAPGYLEEAAAEWGLTMPDDLSAALIAAGIRPVNWEELTMQ